MTAHRIPAMLGLVVLIVASMGAGDDTAARFDKLGHRMMCVCGCNQVLLECNHVGCEYSDRMRGELMAALQRGDSDDLVLQAFVQKYGPTVLAAPTTTGFNFVAWIMPFAALIVGLGLVVLVVRVWRHRIIPAPAGAVALSEAELNSFRQRAREDTQV